MNNNYDDLWNDAIRRTYILLCQYRILYMMRMEGYYIPIADSMLWDLNSNDLFMEGSYWILAQELQIPDSEICFN